VVLGSVLAMQNVLIPEIEENIPLPANAAEALPDLTPEAEVEMRARTIQLVSDLTGTPLLPNEEDMEQAKNLARAQLEDPRTRIDYSKYPNETIAMLAGIAARYNHMIVDDLAELKLYVVNRLFEEAEKADNSKTRIQALSKLGEVDGVDAFKKRSEVTHVIKPIEEVEKELLSVLEGIEYRVIDENAAKPDQI
jgi:vacuolar-type H+-ATPase subunit I/STV1